MKASNNQLTPKDRAELFGILQLRFAQNPGRHMGIEWKKIQAKLEAESNKLLSISEM